MNDPRDAQGVSIGLETAMGSIVVELAARRAPLTCANFLRYVDRGLFQNARFYRGSSPDRPGRPQFIQGGLGPEYELAPLSAPIPHESTRKTGLTHCDGALSMARHEPGTASSEFFIVLAAGAVFDHGQLTAPDAEGYAVFGHVRSGLDVVRRIFAQQRGTTSPLPFMKDLSLIPPVHFIAERLAPHGRDPRPPRRKRPSP